MAQKEDNRHAGLSADVRIEARKHAQETGLYNYNARLYDPQTGTFISPDTIIPGNGERSQGLNRYMYVEGNPVRWNDPSGHNTGYSILEWLNPFGETWPPFYNFAGGGRRANYDTPAITSLDETAKQHDWEGAKVFPRVWKEGGTKEERYKIIGADMKFLAVGASKIFTGFALVDNVKRAWDQGFSEGGPAGWLGALTVGLLYTAFDTIVFTAALFIFSVNIFVLGVQNLGESLGEGFLKLVTGRFEEFFNDLFDW